MHQSFLNNFDKAIKRLLEGHNVFPLPKATNGLQAPVPGKNINFSGPTPAGFKGSGPDGIAPSSSAMLLIKWPKKKKKIKKKKSS